VSTTAGGDLSSPIVVIAFRYRHTSAHGMPAHKKKLQAARAPSQNLVHSCVYGHCGAQRSNRRTCPSCHPLSFAVHPTASSAGTQDRPMGILFSPLEALPSIRPAPFFLLLRGWFW